MPATKKDITRQSKTRAVSKPRVKRTAGRPARRKPAPPAVSVAPAPLAPPPRAQAVPALAREPQRVVSPEQRFRMIQEAAYLIAEKDGFRHHPDRYWFAAEKQIEQLLAKP